MEKERDIEEVLKEVASAADIYENFPAYVARQKSLEYWRTFDYLKNAKRSDIFTKMYIDKEYSVLPDHRLKDFVFVCEKTIGRYRKEYKKVFAECYEFCKTLTRSELETLYEATVITLERLKQAGNA